VSPSPHFFYIHPVVASRGRSECTSRVVEGIRRSVFCWLLWPWISLTVTSYNARYIHQYVRLFTTQSYSHPTHADCPHSQRTLHTPMRKLHTLMRKCLLPQHTHNSPLRPSSPRPLRRAIPRQSLACPGDVTPSPWLQLIPMGVPQHLLPSPARFPRNLRCSSHLQPRAALHMPHTRTHAHTDTPFLICWGPKPE